MSESGAIVVLGLGNPIMGDDGVGLAALDWLGRGWTLPDEVQLVDGGTWGMRLLPLIEDASAMLLLDAIDAGRRPGELVELEGDELPRMFHHKLSPHQVDLREVLALGALRGTLPARLAAVGLQPASVEMGTELSPELTAGLERMAAAAAARLHAWGCAVRPRLEPFVA